MEMSPELDINFRLQGYLIRYQGSADVAPGFDKKEIQTGYNRRRTISVKMHDVGEGAQL